MDATESGYRLRMVIDVKSPVPLDHNMVAKAREAAAPAGFLITEMIYEELPVDNPYNHDLVVSSFTIHEHNSTPGEACRGCYRGLANDELNGEN